ncbi:MAG: TetR/AcrR family transcriptional regulator [Bacteroidaceae bacterium]|nr:TetR/AcrR family transcriptional regulator [Bacteroidaceae bacterium]
MKEDNTKKEIHNLIVETAHTMFIEYGIKDVKMDDIAAKLSISKRTIYELFNDKEQLLHEVLKFQHNRMYENGKEIVRNSSHILEIILKLYNLHFKLLKKVNSKFFSELNKYPEICKERQDKEKRNTKKFCAWMEMGRQQGLFREDADFNIFTFILKRDLTTILEVKMQTGHTELSKYTPEELGRKLILFYLRGISTPKGQQIIEEYLKRNETIIE